MLLVEGARCHFPHRSDCRLPTDKTQMEITNTHRSMKFSLLTLFMALVLEAHLMLAQNVDETTFILLKGDIIKAVTASDAAGHNSLTITFTPEKRVEFNDFTEHNLNKVVKFVCDGKVICQPRLMSAIKGSSMEIPVNTPSNASAIAESVLANLSPLELEAEEQKLEKQTSDAEHASHNNPVRNELVSRLQHALDTDDKIAFEKCFNFDGTTDELWQGFAQIENKIFALPSYYVFDKERIDQGKLHAVKDGRNYTLNGDWTFDVGIYNSKTLCLGYVLPAGLANGKCQVLLTVEDKS